MIPGRITVQLGTRTVSGRDRYQRDETTDSTVAQGGCSLQPAGIPVEVLSSSDQITARWVLRCPPTAAAQAMTATGFVVGPDGTSYEIDGDPQTWPGPTGRPHHVRMFLIERKG